MLSKDLLERIRSTSPVRETRERFGTSYVARLSYRGGEAPVPLGANGVTGTIDLHCHAGGAWQDPMGVAQKASLGKMGGILFKGIGSGDTIQTMKEELQPWCDEHEVEPCGIWGGPIIGGGGVDLKEARDRARVDFESGASAVWLPVFTHANTLTKVATRNYAADAPEAALPPRDRPLHPPLKHDEARRVGHFCLDSSGKLLPEVSDILKMAADHDAVVSLGHVTRDEQWAAVEELDKLDHKKVFIDHPFSPFIDLTLEEMKRFTDAGVYLNFTFDELSPLLGIDPLLMFGAIAQLDPQYVTLSSDAGEPLFPDSIECMRLMAVYANAFGISPNDIHKMTVTNPAFLMGVEPVSYPAKVVN